MFVCDPCHKESQCDWVHLSGSYGRCEICGKSASCHDCGTYRAPKTEEKSNG